MLNLRVYAAQPREGTETTADHGPFGVEKVIRFMQLNPARGRKLNRVRHFYPPSWGGVYAAQPREGTETPKPQ